MTEEMKIQTKIMRTLEAMNIRYCSTSNPRRTLNTIGTPDLFVFNRFNRTWFAYEVKTESGVCSPSQLELLKLGAIVVVRSVDDVLKDLTIRGILK